jgi:polyphosphate kinase 2 (PPK2 family)
MNRSHYEDVVTARLIGVVDHHQTRLRYRHIREFERMLADEGTTVVKVFLHVSKDEQRARLQERIDDPTKNWKFRQSDLVARAHWDEYQRCYDEVLTETSTEWAPWYVVPADHKWVRDVAVAALLVDVFEGLDPRIPEPEGDLRDVVVD